jgi:hypothetical protein
MKISNFFSDAETVFRNRYFGEFEKGVPHPGEKGGIRERRVADFLSNILPKRFGIGTGHIIDPRGQVSGQTDIVIYDAIDGLVG